jgi:hypothetical protein
MTRFPSAHHRPLGAVIALSAELGTRLAGQISADHFYRDS